MSADVGVLLSHNGFLRATDIRNHHALSWVEFRQNSMRTLLSLRLSTVGAFRKGVDSSDLDRSGRAQTAGCRAGQGTGLVYIRHLLRSAEGFPCSDVPEREQGLPPALPRSRRRHACALSLPATRRERRPERRAGPRVGDGSPETARPPRRPGDAEDRWQFGARYEIAARNLSVTTFLIDSSSVPIIEFAKTTSSMPSGRNKAMHCSLRRPDFQPPFLM